MNRDEINKKIIRKSREIDDSDILGPFERYRIENYEIYKRKRNEFLEAARQYRKNNEMALVQNKIKLGKESDEAVQYTFLTDVSLL